MSVWLGHQRLVLRDERLDAGVLGVDESGTLARGEGLQEALQPPRHTVELLFAQRVQVQRLKLNPQLVAAVGQQHRAVDHGPVGEGVGQGLRLYPLIGEHLRRIHHSPRSTGRARRSGVTIHTSGSDAARRRSRR